MTMADAARSSAASDRAVSAATSTRRARPAPLLAPLPAGATPPEPPAWFRHALAQAPERSRFDAGGTDVELLTWGRRGKPGLLLLHGNRAHAGWWEFIAPLFADDYRVAAISWSGMGGSGWRATYAIDDFVGEIMGAIDAGGLRDDPHAKPIVLGHSFGGFPTVAAAARHGDALGGVIIADSPIMSSAMRTARRAERPPMPEPRETRVYETLDEAMQRFRFVPEQSCEHRFIVEHIARGSLKQEPLPDQSGRMGWTWRFDPFMWRDYRMSDAAVDLAGARCPLAVVWGERSSLIDNGALDFLRSQAPAGSPMLAIPDAAHHLMLDQPLAFVAGIRGLLAGWPGP